MLTNLYNRNKKITYLKSSEIAEYFKIPVRKLNEIFEKLKWATKEEKNWLVTQLGITAGAKQFNFKGTKYIKWDSNIKKNFHLITEIKKFKNIVIKKNESEETVKKETKPKNTQKMTNKEKKDKGDKYEVFVANFFREQGYYVWEHGKEKGMLDSSIDLFVKKDKYVYFVQCKNWNTWKINHKEVKATRTDVRDYLKKEKILWELLKDYQSKILYITPKECLTKSAFTYIKENQELVEYQVIPIQE